MFKLVITHKLLWYTFIKSFLHYNNIGIRKQHLLQKTAMTYDLFPF